MHMQLPEAARVLLLSVTDSNLHDGLLLTYSGHPLPQPFPRVHVPPQPRVPLVLLQKVHALQPGSFLQVSAHWLGEV
jgi:hypothetical protein